MSINIVGGSIADVCKGDRARSLPMTAIPVVLLFKGKQIRANGPFMSEASYDEEEVEVRRSSYTRAHSTR